MLRVSLFISILFICSCTPDSNKSDVDKQPTPAPAIEVSPKEDNPSLNGDERRIWQRPEVVMDMFGDLSDKVIVDIGAGIGYFSVLLLPKSKKVIATEIDPDLYKYLNVLKVQSQTRFPNKFDVRLATVNDSKINDNEVDAILLVNTITYISDRLKYLKEMKGKLKSGGKILIVDYKTKKFPDFIKDAPSYKDRVYLHTIEEELEAAGFKWEKSDDTSLEFQYMILATVE